MNIQLGHNPRDPRVPLTVLEQVPGEGGGGEVGGGGDGRLSRKLFTLGQKRQGMLSRRAIGEGREKGEEEEGRAAVLSYWRCRIPGECEQDLPAHSLVAVHVGDQLHHGLQQGSLLDTG